MSRRPLPNLTGEYLICRDAWVTHYHGKATWWRSLLEAPRELLRVPQRGDEGPVWETLWKCYISRWLWIRICKAVTYRDNAFVFEDVPLYVVKQQPAIAQQEILLQSNCTNFINLKRCYAQVA